MFVSCAVLPVTRTEVVLVVLACSHFRVCAHCHLAFVGLTVASFHLVPLRFMILLVFVGVFCVLPLFMSDLSPFECNVVVKMDP